MMKRLEFKPGGEVQGAATHSLLFTPKYWDRQDWANVLDPYQNVSVSLGYIPFSTHAVDRHLEFYTFSK